MPAPRRALIVDLVSRAGGGVSYLHNVADGLVRDGSVSSYDYTFLCHPSVQLHTKALRERANVVFAPGSMPNGGLAGFVWRQRHYEELICRHQPDVVLSMNECPRRLPYPSVLFLRNALYFARHEEAIKQSYPLLQWLRCTYLRNQALASMANVDVILTSTRSFADLVKRDTCHMQVPFDTTPFGVNNDTVSTKKRSYGRCDTLLCLQYNFYKGHEDALRALADVRQLHPSVQMLITDNLARHRLAQGRAAARLISDLQLDSAVQCLGTIPHGSMAPVFEQADAFVFPTKLESFGHGLLEAMANGLPCVVSDIAVFREIAGDCALYVAPGDSASLAGALSKLIDEPSLRERLGCQARQRAAAFSWRKHIVALEAVFDRCIARRNRMAPHG